MIVFISIEAFDSVVFLEVVLKQQGENLVVDGDLRKTNEDTTCYLHMLNLVEPGMLSYIGYFESLFRISI